MQGCVYEGAFVCFCFILFCFPVIPLNGLKGSNYYLHFPLRSQNSEFRWHAKAPATCKQLRQDLNPGMSRGKVQFLSPFWDSLVPVQVIWAG